VGDVGSSTINGIEDFEVADTIYRKLKECDAVRDLKLIENTVVKSHSNR
jgi:hypothetical protein